MAAFWVKDLRLGAFLCRFTDTAAFTEVPHLALGTGLLTDGAYAFAQVLAVDEGRFAQPTVWRTDAFARLGAEDVWGETARLVDAFALARFLVQPLSPGTPGDGTFYAAALLEAEVIRESAGPSSTS